MPIDGDRFRRRALELAARDGRGLGSRLAAEFGISRAAASARLRAMVREGLLVAEGTTRSRTYRLATIDRADACYRTEGLDEEVVWRLQCRPVLRDLPENVRDIWHYGITEMVNNAIEHSGSGAIEVQLHRTALDATCAVIDHGIGIFRKIQEALGLIDPREAMLELAKGKLTTDPEHHTGEGIFFSSKALDHFEIRSGSLVFAHDDGVPDVLAEREPVEVRGTVVVMRLRNDSTRRLREVFDRFAQPEDYTFSRTIVPVRLAALEGEKLLSRSQARRITHRFERFEHVVLDFRGIEEIGQAFADEIFRVFRREHPAVSLQPVNMAPKVEAMVRRALAAART